MLEQFSFLDVESAMPFVGDMEDLYLEVLGSYVEDDRRDSLAAAFDSEDWNQYRIIVHGIKSTSLTIGATQLSEEAKLLEMCCKNNEIEGVKSGHAQLLKNYIDIIEKIKAALG